MENEISYENMVKFAAKEYGDQFFGNDDCDEKNFYVVAAKTIGTMFNKSANHVIFDMDAAYRKISFGNMNREERECEAKRIVEIIFCGNEDIIRKMDDYVNAIVPFLANLITEDSMQNIKIARCMIYAIDKFNE